MMLFFDLLVPATMLGFGALFRRGIPGRVNGMFGYRTKMSTKNDLTWAFAHQYIGRLWKRWGLVTLALTIAAFLLLLGRDKEAVYNVGGWICIAQCLPLVGSIFPTERALKRHFDQDGNPYPPEE